MTNYHITDIEVGESNHPSTVNTRLGALDAAIGNIADTTVSGASAVQKINTLRSLSALKASANTFTAAQIIQTSTNPPMRSTRTGSQTNTVLTAAQITHETDGDAAAGFGPALAASITDTGVTNSPIGRIDFVRGTADNSGDIILTPYAAGVAATNALIVKQTGRVGIGTGAPDTLLHVNGQTKLRTSSNPPADAVRTGSLTNAVSAAMRVVHETDGDAADGFGPSVSFAITDTGVSNSIVGRIDVERNGADNTGRIVLAPMEGGVARRVLQVHPDGAELDGDLNMTEGDKISWEHGIGAVWIQRTDDANIGVAICSTDPAGGRLNLYE
jgi:hypothetical protein